MSIRFASFASSDFTERSTSCAAFAVVPLWLRIFEEQRQIQRGFPFGVFQLSGARVVPDRLLTAREALKEQLQ